MLRRLNIILILLTLVAYLVPHVNPQSFSLLTFLGPAYPWLVMANILFILFWGYHKNWYALFSLGCLIVGITYFHGFFGLNFGKPPEITKNEIQLLSFNMKQLENPNIEHQQYLDERLAEFEKSKEELGTVSVLAAQEVKGVITEGIANAMNLEIAHSTSINHIMTSLPVKSKGEVSFTNNTANSCIWIDVEVSGKIVRIYSLHLQSNRISGVTDKVAKEGDLREEETWLDIKNILGAYRRTAKIRVEQAEKVATHVANCPHPAILCGDFNETPMSYIYRLLAKNRKDSFVEKGLGLGTTYAGNIPFLRIDYILAYQSLDILSHRIYKMDYSDHYGVGARIRID